MAIHFNDITLGYSNNITIKNFSGRIQSGSLTAIVGKNGAGKSTLLKAIAGVIKPLHGQITYKPSQRISYLAQQSEIDRTFPVTIRDLVSMGLWQYCGLWESQKKYQYLIDDALENLGLCEFTNRSLDTLSGGQLQRTLFARIIVQNADIILLDEPFNNIDVETQTKLLSLIHQWKNEGRTILMSLHDIKLIEQNFSHLITIENQSAQFDDTYNLSDNLINLAAPIAPALKRKQKNFIANLLNKAV